MLVKFVTKALPVCLEIIMWLILIGSAIAGYSLGDASRNPELGLVIGVVVGIVLCILIGGHYTSILALNLTLKKMSKKLGEEEEEGEEEELDEEDRNWLKIKMSEREKNLKNEEYRYEYEEDVLNDIAKG